SRFQHAIVNFHRRKSVDVHGGNGAFDGAQEVAVEKAVEVAGKAALNANFGGAAVPGFLGAAHDLFEGERVGIGGLRPAAKSAKAAANEANVGEINVAVDDVSDGLAGGLAPQIIRDSHQRLQASSFGSRQLQSLLERKVLAAKNRFKGIAHGGRALR